MIVELISVGTELLLGNIVNTNAQYLSETCAKLGLNVYYQTTVGDNRERMTEVFRTALSRADLVIIGGGLGKIALSYGYYRYQTNIMIVCVILLVLLVQIFQTVGTFWATRSDKRLRK